MTESYVPTMQEIIDDAGFQRGLAIARAEATAYSVGDFCPKAPTPFIGGRQHDPQVMTVPAVPQRPRDPRLPRSPMTPEPPRPVHGYERVCRWCGRIWKGEGRE